MGRKILFQALVGTGLLAILMILTAPVAYADNCGSLGDCFQTEGAAASVTAGVAVLIAIAVLALPALLDAARSSTRPQGPAEQPETTGSPVPAARSPEYPAYQHPYAEPQSVHQMGPQPGYQPAQQPEYPPSHLPEPQPGHSPVHPQEYPPSHLPEPQPGHSPVHPQEQPPVHQPGQAGQASPDQPEQPSGHQASEPKEIRLEHKVEATEIDRDAQAEQQPQALRSDQQAQMIRPEQQSQVVPPDQQVKLPPSPLVQQPIGSAIHGLHHVTAIAGNPQQNIDFYTGLLGLRLVKLTVDLANPNTYHLYYGDELGRPGTILSFFAWPGAPRGSRGTGQAVAISLSIPEGSLNNWGDYLTRRGINVTRPSGRFDEQVLTFFDPDGLQIEMVAHRGSWMPSAWSGRAIPPEYAIWGIHSVTLLEASYERTHPFLVEVLSFQQIRGGGNRFRYEVGEGGPGALLDLLIFPGVPPSQVTVGTIHHLALRAAGNEQQLALQQKLAAFRFSLAEGIDHPYFPSFSFREPGGALLEIAVNQPGFTIDEPPERLGTRLALPPWLEPRRPELEQVLPPLRLPGMRGPF